MGYMVPVHHCWLWWPKHPGLVSGIILGGFGFGAIIFDNLFTHMINPDNKKADEDTGFYDDDINDRFIKTWRLTVLMWLGLFVIGTAMIFPGPIKPVKRKGRVVTDG